MIRSNYKAYEFYEKGVIFGRKEAIAEIIKLLGIDELIANAIQQHEDQSHE